MSEQSMAAKIVHSVVHLIFHSSRTSVAQEAPQIAHKMGSGGRGFSILKSCLALFQLKLRCFVHASLLAKFLNESPCGGGRV